ncbi:MAG: hypothetical protein Q9226_005609, partial [Calogaya cf. arnoldii]
MARCQYLEVNAHDFLSTAAHCTAQQQPVPLTYIKGGQAYRSYHADALANVGVKITSHGEWFVREGASLVPAPPDLHNDDRAQAIFVGALRRIQEAASEALQRPVQIATVSVPQHFNNSSIGVVMEAFKEVEPSYKQPWQVIKSIRATWLAYGLYTCEAFGLTHDMCDIDEGPHRVLIVEYRETYLQVFIAHVGSRTCNIMTHVRYNNLGEDSMLNAADHANLGGRTQKILQNDDSDAAITTKENHYKKIQNTLSDFLVDQVERESDWWEDVRAVIISGDASESGLQRLRPCVDGALGLHKDKMRDSIDPL